MTIEVTEFGCPTCGHILGEEEYRHACSNHDKARQEIREELSEELALIFVRTILLQIVSLTSQIICG
ncbi:MAG: hypothetical protein WBX01_12890 [Nitrososphaeraceae archaeon]